MKKTCYPVVTTWMVSFLILGINFLIRRDVLSVWMNVYGPRLLVPVGGLFVAAYPEPVLSR